MLTPEHIEHNWTKLISLITSVNPSLLPLVNKFKENLLSINEDVLKVRTYPGLKNAPAGIYVHHAYPGGLVDHLLEMWDIHLVLYNTLLLKDIDAHNHLREAEILETIILHDLHKGYCFYRYPNPDEEKIGKATKWAKGYFQRANEDHLMLVGDSGITVWMCQHAGYTVSSLKVLNAVLNAEGGYSKTQTPWQTVLAKYVYVLDEISSNVLARLQKGNVYDVRNAKNTNSWEDIFES